MKKKAQVAGKILVFALIFWIGLVAFAYYAGESVFDTYKDPSEVNSVGSVDTIINIITWDIAADYYFISLITTFMLVLTVLAGLIVIFGG